MKNVLEYLENSAALCAEKTAVRDPEESYSYRELTDRARRIGSVLSEVFSGAAGKNRGLPGKPAVVYMEKSVRALTSFMGIVYAGRFYTYISPEQPAARIRQILEVLQPDCVIADSESADDGKLEEAGFSGRVLDYDELCRAEISAEVLAEVRE